VKARDGPDSIRERMRRIEDFNGLYYGKIQDWVNVLPDESVSRPDGSVLRTWREDGYTLTLWFDEQDCCRGVWDEKIN